MVPWRSYNGGTGLQRTGSLVSLRNKRLKPSLSSRATMAEPGFNGLRAPKSKRDTYGFALRSQHVQRYREYFNIYKVEEEERSNKWKYFLENVEKSSQSCSPENSDKEELQVEATEQKEKTVSESGEEGNDTISKKTASDLSPERDPEKELKLSEKTETSEVQTWTLIRSSLSSIENMMSIRVRKGRNMKDEQIIVDKDHLPFIEEATSSGMASEDDCEDKICLDDAFNESKNAFSAENSVSDGHSDGEKVAGTGEAVDVGTEEARVNGAPPEPFFPWKLELESLVHGGVPRDLRGEAMNFFAGLLLLLMPEENAFWTLVGIIDDYFDGYYTEEMTES